MDVVHSNFAAACDDVIQLIRTCDFYAMDQEMTGIECKDNTVSPIADPREVYASKRAAAVTYNAFQVGLCLFHKTPGTNEFTARPFNFWLRQRGKHARDVTLNADAVDFLISHGMNFQKWLAEGVTFVNAERANAERKWSSTDVEGDLSDDDAKWLERAKAHIAAWSSETEETELPDVSVSVTADLCLHQHLRTHHTHIIAEPALHHRLTPSKPRRTKLRRVSADAAAAHWAADAARREQRLNDALGFRRVFEALLARKDACMVGHHFSSDLMFFLNQFEVGLPLCYSAFKGLVHDCFPKVADTKVLATCLPPSDKQFQNSSLGPLFDELEAGGRKFGVRLPLGFESYAADVIVRAKRTGGTNAAAHQGAFDAYMTGVVYLHFIEKYGRDAVDALENDIAVFGMPYFMGLGKKQDHAAHCAAFHVATPSRVFREDIEALIMTDEELAARKDRPAGMRAPRADQRPPWSVWSVDKACVLVVLRPPPADNGAAVLERAKARQAALPDEHGAKAVVWTPLALWARAGSEGDAPAGKRHFAEGQPT